MSVISFSNQFSRCFSHNSGGFLSGARTGDPFIPCGQPTVVMYNTRDDCPQERLDPFIPCLPLHRATATVCFLPQLFSPRLRSKNVEFTRNRLQRPAGSIRESRQTCAFVQNHRDQGKPVHLNFVICKNELLPCWHIQTTECEHRGDLFDTRAKI